MSIEETKVVLSQGVSLFKWIADLQSALVRRRCIGHVFHDIEGIPAVVCPLEPKRGNESDEEYNELLQKYRESLQKFQEGEIEARNILSCRIDREICPQNLLMLSAKQLYEHVIGVREEGANTPWETAVKDLLLTKLTTTVDQYCNEFMQHYMDANSAAETMHSISGSGSKGNHDSNFKITPGLAGYLFVLGTESIEWLETWRQTKVYDANNKYVSLDIMMSTLRQVAKGREFHSTGSGKVALGYKINGGNSVISQNVGNLNDPEAICSQCKHKHKNKNCFKQHPELRKQNKRRNAKGKAKFSAAQDSEESESDLDDSNEDFSINAVAKASSIRMKNRLLYDTGASHHFVNCKSDFLTLKKLSKPFEFDQAVGKSKLLYRGICRLLVGNLTLDLKNAFYSPDSSCNIVSAVKLKEEHGIVAACNNEVLVSLRDDNPRKPVGKLKSVEGVLFIQPCCSTPKIEKPPIVAPGVARIPHTSSAQRWHERLGHIGQKLLKETMRHAIGLEGVDLSELTTCETCHLSKAQRYISREPRPIPNEPLDEVFVDSVGKIAAALNGVQYAVILTDAKTRMRWIIVTKGKDEIADHLVKWIEHQHHQFGKRVRAIFRDGGSEFMRMKEYCEQHRIRTDVSAPYTPEQNGVAEAANKVILQRARSLLIDAGMPPCFWPWAVEHSCFITNRLICLRTKTVPIIDFLKGLNQPYNEKIDFTPLPRFGCRAYKMLNPKPGKFEARAEKGWFIGFQKNTSKNYLIYHPHWTPKHGWRWIESITPHVSFNEDIIFGDMLSPTDKQKTISFWNSPNTIPVAKESGNTSLEPQQRFQTYQFEGENKVAPKIPQIPPINRKNPTPELTAVDQPDKISPPNVPNIPIDVWPTSSAELISTIESKSERLIESKDATSPPSSVESDYDDTDEDPGESSQHKRNDDEDENEIVRQGEYDSSKELIQQRTEEDKHDRIMTGWDPIPALAGHKRKRSPGIQPSNRELVRQREYSSPTKPNDDQKENYDFAMTGWDPIPPIAGQKRSKSPEPEVTRSKKGRLVKKVDYHKLHHGKTAQIIADPKTWSEAMLSPEAKHWQNAAEEEVKSLKETGTIRVINRNKLPKGRTLMKSKWVFKKKYHADGTLEKYRARCTVKGYTQRPGIDYKETFAPTPRPETGRIMLALAHSFGWCRRQGDVPVAFLNPDLDIDLYMELPEGFKKENKIILIKKGLYGLKQAAALWYDDMKTFLETQGLLPTEADVCLYTNKNKNLFVIIHVDDIQVMGPIESKVQNLMRALHKKYKLKTVATDLFLGINISNPSKNTLKLSQEQYARKLLTRHGMENCRIAKSPLERLMEPSSSKASAQLVLEYSSIIGGLQYLANNTRPDISHSVNHLARFLINPSDEHLGAARRVLRYIAADPTKGITFLRSHDKPRLEAYSDADFAGDPSTSRSTSGSLIRLSSGPICWRSHLQRDVVLSTTEAEYLAATEACRQLKWVKSVLETIGLQESIEGSIQTNFYIDNQSAIALIKNHDNHKRSKHIALRNHFCRQQFKNGEIIPIYIESKKQLADGLTKVKSLIQL